MTALVVLTLLAAGMIFFGRQIEIGPFDEEGESDVVFVTEYFASLTAEDRTDSAGNALVETLAILRRDRENLHQPPPDPSGSTPDTRSSEDSYFATASRRVQLGDAILSIPEDLEDRLLTEDVDVRVLVHSRAGDARLLVGVSPAEGIHP